MVMANNAELYLLALESLSRLPGFQKSALRSRFGNVKAECIPCLYYEYGEYIYDCYERGSRFIHRTTTNIDEALYWVYSDIIHEIGFSYELENRKPLQDSRRITFKKMDELFSVIGEPYRSMWGKELEALLAVAPFEDEIHKILFLVHTYEKMVTDLGALMQDMSPVGQKATESIKKRHYRNPMGGMENPLQSVGQMRNAILIIRDNMQNSRISLSPIAKAFVQSVLNSEEIATQVNGLVRQA